MAHCTFFELGEITDDDLAKDESTSLRFGVDGEGGLFSEEEPLLRIIRKKTASTYQPDGAPLDLVLHYDVSVRATPGAFSGKRTSGRE